MMMEKMWSFRSLAPKRNWSRPSCAVASFQFSAAIPSLNSVESNTSTVVSAIINQSTIKIQSQFRHSPVNPTFAQWTMPVPVYSALSIIIRNFKRKSILKPNELRSIRFNNENFYRFCSCFVPRTQEICSQICRQGFTDALRFLTKNCIQFYYFLIYIHFIFSHYSMPSMFEHTVQRVIIYARNKTEVQKWNQFNAKIFIFKYKLFQQRRKQIYERSKKWTTTISEAATSRFAMRNLFESIGTTT